MKILVIGGLIVGLLGGVGIGLAHRADREETPARGQLRRLVTANGKAEGGREELEVRAEVGGTLARVLFRENQQAAPGDLLAELDNRAQKAELKQAQASLAVARVTAQQAEKELNRVRRAGISVSLEQQDAFHFRNLIAQAQTHEADARLLRAEAELAKTQLRAPWPGRVLRVYMEPGALVGPTGRQPILRFADLSRRRVRAFIEELDVFEVRKGQPATIAADGHRGKVWRGLVADLMPRMSNDAVYSDAPGEYQGRDVNFREVLIDLEGGEDLPLNYRVRVQIDVSSLP